MGRKPVEVTLTEAAEILGGMNRSNVSGFLERRGVEPVDATPGKRKWLKRDIDRVWREYQRSGRPASDAKRRVAARRA